MYTLKSFSAIVGYEGPSTYDLLHFESARKSFLDTLKSTLDTLTTSYNLVELRSQ